MSEYGRLSVIRNKQRESLVNYFGKCDTSIFDEVAKETLPVEWKTRYNKLYTTIYMAYPKHLFFNIEELTNKIEIDKIMSFSTTRGAISWDSTKNKNSKYPVIGIEISIANVWGYNLKNLENKLNLTDYQTLRDSSNINGEFSILAKLTSNYVIQNIFTVDTSDSAIFKYLKEVAEHSSNSSATVYTLSDIRTSEHVMFKYPKVLLNKLKEARIISAN